MDSSGGSPQNAAEVALRRGRGMYSKEPGKTHE